MPADVIIDPTNGQIYWNDGTGTPQSISIKGDALNAISFVGYSGSYSPGSAPGGASTLVTVNDNSGTDALVPGTSGFNLGSSILRWNTFATNANLSGTLVVSDATISASLLSGSTKINGGIAISGNASIGQSLNFYNTAATFYTGFKAGSISANTLYTLPTSFPSTGSSVLQSDSTGIMSWVPMTATSSSSAGGTVASGTQYQLAGYYSGSGASVSGSSTLLNNIAIGQVQIAHTTASFGTSSGALQVAGGVGISGRLSFNQASFGTTGIATNPSMAMIGQTGDPIFMSILEDNSISFEGSQGQLFSISPNLTTGYIWAVNDISGVPLLRASVGGTIGIAEFGGVLGIGQTNPTYKLDLKGSFGLASSNDALYNFIFSNSAVSGSNSFQVRSANSIQLYNSGNTFYTGLKSNASTNVTYTLPATDGSSGQFLQTNGTGTLSWATATGGAGSGSSGVNPGGQYQIGYYASTGASIDGSSTFTNNTSTNVVSITHNTVSTNFSNGALTVSGGVGIGGSLYVGGIGASISGVRITSGAITAGAWNGTVVATQYGGTGQNLSSSSGILTISSGTVSASTTSSALSGLLSDETGSGVLVFNTRPSFGTGVTTGDATFAVFNTNATTINAFGAATVMSIGAATGKATFNSTDNSTTVNTGSLVVSGGAGFAKSISVGGYLQLFNTNNYTSFVSAAIANTVYTLPTSSPATGTSVLAATSEGVMSWVPLATGSGSVNSGTANYAAYYATTSTALSQNANLQFTGTGLSVGGNISSSSTLTGSLIVRGGLGITGNAFIGSTVTIQDSTVSSSTTTGALVVSGGIGVGGKVFSDTVQTSGNAAIGGNLTVAGTVDLGNATSDTISFLGRVDTDIDPISDNTYELGTPGLAWKNAAIGGSVFLTNTSNTNIVAIRAGATGSSLTYIFPIDTPTSGQVLAASAPSAGVVTLSWEDDQTGAPAGGITQLNGLTAATQSFATGTSGTDFGISSATSTHTFNLPDAGSSARGVVSTSTQTFAGAKTFSSALSVTDSTVSTNTSTGALTVTGGVGIGGSLYTSTGSSSSVSGVILANGNVSATTYNKLTLTAPATSATLTLANGSSLITSGGNSLTFTTTANSSLTMPTAGTLTTTGNKLSVFASTSSSELLGIISDPQGSGQLVFATSPSFTTPTLGVASATSINKVTITAPATSATLTLANGSSLITSGGNSLTFTTTATTSLTLPTAGTLTTTGNKLSVFASTSSSELLGIISDPSGSGQLVFATSPSFTTPTLGVASATSVNKVTITAPATSATLTLANGSSLITSGGNSLTFTTTATSNVTVPTAGTLTTTGNKLSVFASTSSSELAGIISDKTGSGALVFATSPDFTTSVTTGSGTFSLFNATATTINAFGAATVMSIGAATGKATFNSTDNSTSTTTGSLVISGGAGIAKSVSVGGRLQMFNGANFTAFVSAASSDVVYTLPPTAPAGVGSSYLSASTTGVMAWVAAPTSGGSATPGGSNKQIQYNSSNTFAGASGFEYTTGGTAVTVSVFSPSGTGYTSGLWVSAINGTTTRVGIGLSNPAYELEILGEISATNKSFVIDHPTKDGMKLRYGSLEGPENGVYVRGELKGTNIIEVPDHWVGLVHEDSYTVHLTPIGRFSQLYVEKIENYNVFVADTMMCPIHCYYSVWAERKDIPKLVTEYEAQ